AFFSFSFEASGVVAALPGSLRVVGVKRVRSDLDFQTHHVRVDQYQGADAVGLEEKTKHHLENSPGSNEDTDIPKGYMDFMLFY
ncbi:hypothetical protein EI555_007440, partial [Monodon monoceros]